MRKDARLNPLPEGESEDWGPPPSVLEPPGQEVHLWRVLLDAQSIDCCCLAPDEQARADKLVHSRHRHRFITMRSALRSILARYLAISPASIAFVYGDKGKPSLAADQNGLDLRFNVSHSGGLGIVAVTCGCEVGVDVETRQEVFDYMAIARRFFSAREHAALAEVPEQLCQRAFLRCWTRKESYVKALGKGLACALDSFSVSVSPEICQDALLETGCPGKYHLADVRLPDGYCAALTLEGADRRRCRWTYV